MRVFFGVPIDAPARAQIALIQRDLAKLAPGRFTPPQNLHITLRFIGETKELGALSSALTNACVGVAPFTVNITGLGAFERQGRTLIFAKVEDNQRKLDFLYESLESALGDIGFFRERRAFKPHITLCRDYQRARLPDGVAVERIELGVGAAVLFESLRTHKGMEYLGLQVVRF